MMMVIVLVAAVVGLVLRAMWHKRETFTWSAPPGTYTFGARVPETASQLNRTLGAVVDTFVPKDVLDNGGEPQPDAVEDQEAEDIVRDALSRAKHHDLTFISVDSVGKSIDTKGNKYFDIIFLAHDRVRVSMTKVALTALVTATGKTFVRRFGSVEPDADLTAPMGAGGGASAFAVENAPFENALGIDYAAMYK